MRDAANISVLMTGIFCLAAAFAFGYAHRWPESTVAIGVAQLLFCAVRTNR